MIKYADCKQILLNEANSAFLHISERVRVENSVGRIVSEDLISREENPTFDNSAMDGFAFNFEQIIKALHKGITFFNVTELVAAGDAPGRIKTEKKIHVDQSEAGGEPIIIEIMTGAAIPSSYFDSIVKIEDVEVVMKKNKKTIRFKGETKKGENVRYRGEDIKKAQLLFKRGTRIEPQHLIPLASQGIIEIPVLRELKCAIFSTGKELVSPDVENLEMNKIRNATGIFLEAALKKYPTSVTNYGIVTDEKDQFKKELLHAFEMDSDVLISTGAVSMGIFDFVREAVEELGGQVLFHKSAIRPGKPILFSTFIFKGKKRFFFGVPGNPVSTLV